MKYRFYFGDFSFFPFFFGCVWLDKLVEYEKISGFDPLGIVNYRSSNFLMFKNHKMFHNTENLIKLQTEWIRRYFHNHHLCQEILLSPPCAPP